VPPLQQAAELNPDEPIVFYLLALALRGAGRAEEAKQALRRVNELQGTASDTQEKLLQDANVVGAR